MSQRWVNADDRQGLPLDHPDEQVRLAASRLAESRATVRLRVKQLDKALRRAQTPTRPTCHGCPAGSPSDPEAWPHSGA
jgi:hypothetical protein